MAHLRLVAKTEGKTLPDNLAELLTDGGSAGAEADAA
jgi:hypothetical protein